ncbi:MAG: hypothetical protein ACXAC7_23235 [Candidatus Hodarchaeales archaeon]|jgi:uncharacterized membrane protein YidH (DUF202 family)
MIDTLLLIKIIVASVTVLIALVAGFIELRLNPKSWLNRWFALFFISSALGFFTYTFYHSINTGDFYADQGIIIPMLITTQILLNIPALCLVMTVFILEKYKKIALNYKHLGTMIALLFIMSIGYFIPTLTPYLNQEDYNNNIINTETNDYLSIFVNILRLILFVYVIFKYTKITQKVEEDTKKRIQWFFRGVIIIIVGVIINLIGGIFGVTLLGAIGETLIEVLALILLDIGIFLIVKGFLI